MIKKNLSQTILTGALTLLPMAAGLILWQKLPDEIAIHFDLNGNADGFASKGVVVFLIPLIFLAIHLYCIAVSEKKLRSNDSGGKNLQLIFWIIPAISLLICTITYLYAFKKDFEIALPFCLFLGFLIIACGNYLPKLRRNKTIGIKIPTTLRSEENWNSTHRFSGKLWVAGGLFAVFAALFRAYAVFAVIMAVIVLAPVIYSAVFQKKHSKS